jgi:hypothetical protein
MMVVARPAGDVGIDMPVALQPSRDAGRDKRLERPEDGRAPDVRRSSAKPLVQVLGGGLAAGGGQRIGDDQSLAGDALAGRTQPIGSRCGAQCAPTAPANTEKP